MGFFKKAIESLLELEGGYSDHPEDPGGKTKYGISQRSYPELDIENLALEDAIQIYKRDFWDKAGISLLKNEAIAIKAFQTAVWMGPYWSLRCLQRALIATGRVVVPDGILGPVTAASANGADPVVLLAAYKSEVAGRVRELVARNPKLGVFEKGWLRRAYS